MTIQSKPEPHRPRTAREFVYDEVTRAIATGELQPGARLNEKSLSEWLNVSRTPIRESLNALDADGFVELIPHHGAVVRTMDPEDLRDEYILRTAYESLAVERSVPRLPQSELDHLATVNTEMHRALEQGEISTFLRLNRTFHLGLYASCDSRRLLSLIESSWDREDTFRRCYYTSDDAVSAETHMHDELLEAYQRRDAARARDVVKESLLATGTLLADRLASRTEPSSGTRTGPSEQHTGVPTH